MMSKKEFATHVLTIVTAIGVIVIDQWTKNLVVEHLSPPDSGPSVSLIGNYLTLYYIQNRNSAMGLLSNSTLLIILIIISLIVLIVLYLRFLRSGSLAYKLLFGMILGGAVGNIIDRFRHSGYVVDFIFFRIPQLGFQFYIFNLADAAISLGVLLLFILMLFGNLREQRKGQHPTMPHKEL